MNDNESPQNSSQRTQIKGAPNPSRSDVDSANRIADQAAGHANKQRRESDAAARSPKRNPHYSKHDYGMADHFGGKKPEPGLRHDTGGRLSSGIERESRAAAQNARSKGDSYSYPSPTQNRVVTGIANRIVRRRPLKDKGKRRLLPLNDENLADSKKSLFVQSLRQTPRSQEEVELLETLYRSMCKMERKLRKQLDIAENLALHGDLPRMKKSLHHANDAFWNYVQLQKAIEEHCSETSCVIPKLPFDVMERMQNLRNA